MGEAAEAFEAQLLIKPDGVQEWVMRSLQENTYEKIINLIKQGFNQHEVAEQIKIHKSNVSRYLKRAHQEGKIVNPYLSS